MTRSLLLSVCALVCLPSWAGGPLRGEGMAGADRNEQRRAELRQAISSQRVDAAPQAPLRTLSDRERAELREQLRRESPGLSRVRDGRPDRPTSP